MQTNYYKLVEDKDSTRLYLSFSIWSSETYFRDSIGKTHYSISKLLSFAKCLQLLPDFFKYKLARHTYENAKPNYQHYTLPNKMIKKTILSEKDRISKIPKISVCIDKFHKNS